MHSQACERLPMGTPEHGLYRLVALYLEVTMYYFIKEGLLKSGLYLQDGLYLEMAFNTILTVYFRGLFIIIFLSVRGLTLISKYLLFHLSSVSNL